MSIVITKKLNYFFLHTHPREYPITIPPKIQRTNLAGEESEREPIIIPHEAQSNTKDSKQIIGICFLLIY